MYVADSILECTDVKPTSVEILAAFRRALRHHGASGATMERIAQEAGITRVTLHRRGITREALFVDLVQEATEHYRAAMWPVLVADGPAARRLAQALAVVCQCAEAELELLVALRARADAIFHEFGGDEPMTASVFAEPLERILSDGVADGSIISRDPAEQATLLFNLVGWTYVHLRTGHNWAQERAQNGVIEIAMRGVTSS